MSDVLVLSCSPRKGGNSDTLAEFFSSGVSHAGAEAKLLFLRDFHIRPCTACGVCSTAPDNSCALGDGDDAELLFSRMARSSMVVLCSPVYFYALPAVCKAFIDRAQRFWHSEKREAMRPFWSILVGARTRGDRLFEGSELTLRYFGRAIGLSLTDCIHCYGYDAPHDVLRDSARCAAMRALGEKAGGIVLGKSECSPR